MSATDPFLACRDRLQSVAYGLLGDPYSITAVEIADDASQAIRNFLNPDRFAEL